MNRIPRKGLAGLIILILVTVVTPVVTGTSSRSAHAQSAAQAEPTGTPPATQYFPQTGHSVNALFLLYWRGNGGLAQQGYPISEEMQEVSPLDGHTYTVQYFERAVFEDHPEIHDPKFLVLLSQLGTFRYKQKYPKGAPGQNNNEGPPGRYFPETNQWVGGAFLQYWNMHGGLAQQGYPISGEFQEKNDLNGQTYTVQYFERAVFELHPENAGTPFEVLLSQLGKFRYDLNYGGNKPTATPVPRPTATVTVGNLQTDCIAIRGGENCTDHLILHPTYANSQLTAHFEQYDSVAGLGAWTATLDGQDVTFQREQEGDFGLPVDYLFGLNCNGPAVVRNDHDSATGCGTLVFNYFVEGDQSSPTLDIVATRKDLVKQSP